MKVEDRFYIFSAINRLHTRICYHLIVGCRSGNMKRRIDDYIDTLRKLYQCNVDKRKRWLELHLDDDFAFVICDCAKNILSGNLKINDVQKNRLRQYKQDMRTLINKRVGISKKKEIIQSGGLVSAILSPIISLFGSTLDVKRRRNE